MILQGDVRRKGLCLVFIFMLMLCFSGVGFASVEGCAGHYKMISSLEYSGAGQFRSQVEGLYTVKKELLSADKVQYVVSTKCLGQQYSFIVDQKNHQLSGLSEEMAFLGKVSNQGVKSLKKVSKNNIGKTWKQSLDLSSLGSGLSGELKFTLTAIELETEAYGEMIAVRALSEPFVIKAGEVTATSRINTVYLFDPAIEDVYVSVSVFEAKARIKGMVESVRHEVATYKTDSSGKAVDLSGLGKNFEKFVGKIGLSANGLKVVKECDLPKWVQSEGLRAAQVANIYSAIVCEGALNPVATIYMPAARTVALQGSDELASSKSQLAAEIGGENLGQKLWSALTGKSGFWPQAAVIGGATVGIVAVAGGFDGGGGGDASPK